MKGDLVTCELIFYPGLKVTVLAPSCINILIVLSERFLRIDEIPFFLTSSQIFFPYYFSRAILVGKF